MTPKQVDATVSFVPRPYQHAAHFNLKRFSVIVWHRRSGKTTFAVIELLMSALKCKKELGRFCYISPFYGQSKAVCWEILKRYAVQIPGVQIREGELTVIFTNGSAIRLFGADNPDALRGLYFDGVVMDEVAQMKPHVWGEIIRPALADRQGWALFIGTPKGLNLFSELYQSAIKDADWFHDLKRWNDTNIIARDEIEKAKREMAPPVFAQEFECDFHAAAVDSFIPLDLVLEATSRSLPEHGYYYAAKVLGVDVARFGDDSSVIFPRQGFQAFEPRVFRQLNLMEYSNQVSLYMDSEKADMTFVDEVGIGAGVVDRLRQLGRNKILGVNSGSKPSSPKFKNLRAEMWSKMRDWMKDGGCLPDINGIEGDMCAPMYWFDVGDRLQIESKEQMKARGLHSPDLADALALTFASSIQKPDPIHELSRSSDMCKTEYDVLA